MVVVIVVNEINIVINIEIFILFGCGVIVVLIVKVSFILYILFIVIFLR